MARQGGNLMREILFRGKAKNGDWVYGNFAKVERNNDSGLYDYHIIQMPKDGYTAYIDPETIGQYTGIKDRSGVKIFEGDIINILGDIGEVRYFHDAFVGNMEDGIEDDLYAVSSVIEVIGNIYENPELINKKDYV
jgi:uncharacterized phage protein (TIGR01671 family)